MTDLRKAAEDLLEGVEAAIKAGDWKVDGACDPDSAIHSLRQTLNVDAVPGFTATEPRQSLSRMKPGDRFILVRTGEIYHIKQDGSQWNETRQRPARLHKNSQVRLIVTHPKCDDACMNICTKGFTKPPTCKTPDIDAVNISQERVDETAKREHEPVAWMGIDSWGVVTKFRTNPFGGGIPLYKTPLKREWVGLTDDEVFEFADTNLYEGGKNYGILSFGKAIEAKLKEKNGG